MRTILLLVATALLVGAFTVGRLTAQEYSASCRQCPSTYIPASEIAEYTALGRADLRSIFFDPFDLASLPLDLGALLPVFQGRAGSVDRVDGKRDERDEAERDERVGPHPADEDQAGQESGAASDSAAEHHREIRGQAQGRDRGSEASRADQPDPAG